MKSNLCRLNVIFAETIYYNFNVSHAKKRPTAAFLVAACSICLFHYETLRHSPPGSAEMKDAKCFSARMNAMRTTTNLSAQKQSPGVLC